MKHTVRITDERGHEVAEVDIEAESDTAAIRAVLQGAAVFDRDPATSYRLRCGDACASAYGNEFREVADGHPAMERLIKEVAKKSLRERAEEIVDGKFPLPSFPDDEQLSATPPEPLGKQWDGVREWAVEADGGSIGTGFEPTYSLEVIHDDGSRQRWEGLDKEDLDAARAHGLGVLPPYQLTESSPAPRHVNCRSTTTLVVPINAVVDPRLYRAAREFYDARIGEAMSLRPVHDEAPTKTADTYSSREDAFEYFKGAQIDPPAPDILGIARETVRGSEARFPLPTFTDPEGNVVGHDPNPDESSWRAEHERPDLAASTENIARALKLDLSDAYCDGVADELADRD